MEALHMSFYFNLKMNRMWDIFSSALDTVNLFLNKEQATK